MSTSDRNHPFLRPLWRRLAVIAVCLAWLGFEIVGGNGLWIAISGGLTAYGIWALLIAWQGGDSQAPEKNADDPGADS